MINKTIIKMQGNSYALRELLLKIDPKANIPFGDCNCVGHQIKVRVVCSLDENKELKITGFEFPIAGVLGQEDNFNLTFSGN